MSDQTATKSGSRAFARNWRLSGRWPSFEGVPQRFLSPRRTLARSIAGALEARRLFVLLPFAIIAGLLAYRLSAFEPDLRLVLVAGLTVAALFVRSAMRNASYQRWSLVLAVWLGFALLGVHGALYGTPMLYGSVFGSYRAQIVDILSASENAQRIIVGKLEPVGDAPHLPIRKARLFVRNGPELHQGDTIEAPMRLAKVPGPATIGGFDSQFHAYFDGIGAYGNTTSPPDILSRRDWPFGFDTLRRAIGTRIDAALGQPERGIARALIIGDQRQVNDQARAMMAAAGLAHVLAISGLHLTLVAGGIFAAIRLLLSLSYGAAQRWPVKKIAALGGMVAALFYLGLSGAGVSAVRATIMLLLVFGAVLAGRRALTMRNVALAALFLLIVDPASLFRPGFQLSFSAVAALVAVYEMAGRREDKDIGWAGRTWRFFAGMALTSFVAGLATALFAAYHFQQTAPLGVIGNMLALPLVGFVMLPSAVMAVLAMPLGFEQPFLWTMGDAIAWVLMIAHMVASWSAGLDFAPLLRPSALLVGLAALGWFVFLNDRWRFLGPALVLPAVLLFCLDAPPDVLVSDSTQAVSLTTGDGMALLTGRTGSFITDVWSETYGMPISQGDPGFGCDKLGCVGTLPSGAEISVLKSPAAFAEDCRSSALVIARIPAPEACRDMTQVIDPTDLETGGVQWLRWDANRNDFERRSAITDVNRPWRVPRR